MLRLFPCLLALFFAACAGPAAFQSVPMPDQSRDLENPDHARIYFIRPSATAWKRFPLEVFNGGEQLGSLATGSHLCWERPAGRVLVRLVQHREAGRFPIEKLYDRELEAGKVYWVRIPIATAEGIPEPELLGEAEGRELVASTDAAAVQR